MDTNTKSISYAELEALKAELRNRVERLKNQLHQAEKKLSAIEMTLHILEHGIGNSDVTIGEIAERVTNQIDAEREKFYGLTQIQALVKIAKESPDRRFKLTEARDRLLRVGLIKSHKNANNIIWNAIQRSERFRRVAPGTYELIERLQPIAAPTANTQQPVGVIKERFRSSG